MYEKIKKYLVLTSAIIGLFFFLFLYMKENKNKNAVEDVVISQIEKDDTNEDITAKISKIFVDIKGEVKKPGVYEFTSSDKVIDAIKKAGGLTKKGITTNINLSQQLKNEMVIYIFSKDDFTTTTSIMPSTIKETTTTKKLTSTTTKLVVPECKCETIEVNNCPSNEIIKDNNPQIEVDINNPVIDPNTLTNKVNINTASEEELTTLTGIGISKAKAIVEYRNNNGLFKSIEDIKNVSGLGDALFDKIKDSITV